MTEDPHAPDRPSPQATDRPVADALKGHWVDTRAPEAWRPYLRLSRLERPIGTWLLFLPCLWGVALAMLWDGTIRPADLWIAVGCGIGALLMRGAGCTWNDITDRHIDGSVARTALRPIPSGAVSVRQALLWMGAQCLLALAILLSFNTAAILLGVLALLPVAVYPFAKRFTWWPQAFLGIAFNWGALLGFAAHAGELAWPAGLSYLAGIFWTLFYDTIYAHQDAEDDALIGVKSTARLFADDSPLWLKRFALLTVVFLGLAGALAAQGGLAMLCAGLLGPLAMAAHLGWQLRQFDPDGGEALTVLFRTNRDAGLIPLIFMGFALLL